MIGFNNVIPPELLTQLIESDNKDSFDYLEEATNELQESLKELKQIQTDHVYQVVSNFILVSIIMFFMYLIFRNIFNVSYGLSPNISFIGNNFKHK